MSIEADQVIKNVGTSLLEFSETAETTARGLVTELFPYIYLASKRMSSRAISEFLKSQHGVKISAASVARALREPKKHLAVLWDEIEPAVRIFADAHQTSEFGVLHPVAFEYYLKEAPFFDGEAKDVLERERPEYDDAVNTLQNSWFNLDERFREFALTHFFRFEPHEPVESTGDGGEKPVSLDTSNE